MKKYYFTLFLFVLSTTVFGQSDTTDLYVINKTNRFVAIQADGKKTYSFFYRDLKFLRETKEFSFKKVEDAVLFFDRCEKSLETDKTLVTEFYNVSRNKLNKNVVRVNNKEGGYVMIKYDTLTKMRRAFEKSIGAK
jgi:hypothetical protein